MPRLEFQRADLKLTITGSIKRGALLTVDRGEAQRISPERLTNWSAAITDRAPLSKIVREMGRALNLRQRLKEFARRMSESLRLPQIRAGTHPTAETSELARLGRITLDIRTQELAAFSWESVIDAISGRRIAPIVRVSPVLPRFRTIPFTLPIRILAIGGAADQPNVPALLRRVFDRPQLGFADAMQVEQCEEYQVHNWHQYRLQWPTAEVLHFLNFTSLSLAETLRVDQPEYCLTLGGLSRLTDSWQTRLVILETSDPARRLPILLALAHALVSRGGPAVLVSGKAFGWAHFYGQLVHDFPLDACLPLVDYRLSRLSAAGWLFAGANREEGLRASTLGLQLSRLGETYQIHPASSHAGSVRLLPLEFEISPEPGATTGEVSPDIRTKSYDDYIDFDSLVQRNASQPPTVKRAELLKKFDELRTDWATWQFEHRESAGILPMAHRVKELRDILDINAALAFDDLPSNLAAESIRAGGPRHVNAAFWQVADGGQLQRIQPDQGWLIRGAEIHLRIQIGPRDIQIRTVGPTAFLEEVIKWTPQMQGEFLEIGVTGIDFDIVGCPVQELWLPRTGASEAVSFVVSPRLSGVARLRFCVYYKGNAVQSFKMAAIVIESAQATPPPPSERVRLLARALDMDSAALQSELGGPDSQPQAVEVPDAAYLVRQEFSLGTDLADYAELQPPALSLVVNDSMGQSVVTLKTPNSFVANVSEVADPDRYVETIRSQLLKIETAEDKRYRFMVGGTANAGTPEMLHKALQDLAATGYALYSALFQGEDRDGLETHLSELADDSTIQVAHILSHKVLPWSLIYDREFDAEVKKSATGKPLVHLTCTVPIESWRTGEPAPACRASLQCPLHPDNPYQRDDAGQPLTEERTVVCPRHFWGLRHQIENPPYQMPPGQAVAPPVSIRTKVTAPMKLLMGAHGGLKLLQPHTQQLVALLSGVAGGVVWQPVKYDRDDVRTALDEADLGLIYFYCHAEENGGPAKEPCLIFRGVADGSMPGSITASDLNPKAKWPAHPLIILNGCGTVGFSPKALSPFVSALVRNRGAAGVLGTEITIFEGLACEATSQFLRSFLIENRSAGESLLGMRRSLLSKNNPLGLVYTLYAMAALKVQWMAAADRADPHVVLTSDPAVVVKST